MKYYIRWIRKRKKDCLKKHNNNQRRKIWSRRYLLRTVSEWGRKTKKTDGRKRKRQAKARQPTTHGSSDYIQKVDRYCTYNQPPTLTAPSPTPIPPTPQTPSSAPPPPPNTHVEISEDWDGKGWVHWHEHGLTACLSTPILKPV